MGFYKLLRHLLHSNYRNQVKNVVDKRNNVIFSQRRYLYSSSKFCVKMHMEHEYNYAYSIMENKGYALKINFDDKMRSSSVHSLQDLLSQNWSQEKPKKIFETFPLLGQVCSEQNLCISNKIFDDFIDNLTDNLADASDEELKSVFYSLLNWPQVKYNRTRNFIEVWVALEDECLKRLKHWTYDEMLMFVTLFYMLNIIRVSDFPHKCLLRLASKAKHLTPAQLVQCMFFIGVRKYSPDNVHNFEVCISENFDKFTIDELAIISMGFFKGKTPIRNINFVENIINKMKENSSQIHEISLIALLSIIHYSVKYGTDDTIYNLLDKLHSEIPRLSVLCNVHLGLLGTSTSTLHKGCLNAIADKINASMSEARIKDLERLALIFGTLNYKPNCKDLFSNIIKEFKKPEREPEINYHGRSFACGIANLGLLGLYDQELIKKVLDPIFLEKTYGKYCVTYGREILTLHNIATIFFKDSNISPLSDKEAVLLAKKYTYFLPDEKFQKKFNTIERIFLDVFDILNESRGSGYVTGGHVISHHPRGDIILCNDSKGSAVSVRDAINNNGLLWSPPDSKTWIVLVIGGRNCLIRNTNIPSGQYSSKIRELKTLGFCAELVIPEILARCETNDAKLQYLNDLINKAVKNK
ncbi:FAST kinase domain-containing protein 5, mitochondrial-like [Battus philenor]|uniref:FAST kinase domain-containing protein 5, mitochondrial-like n=1 Tax=Battus philenor TaxID=42288 RepID=UPI0035D0064B